MKHRQQPIAIVFLLLQTLNADRITSYSAINTPKKMSRGDQIIYDYANAARQNYQAGLEALAKTAGLECLKKHLYGKYYQAAMNSMGHAMTNYLKCAQTCTNKTNKQLEKMTSNEVSCWYVSTQVQHKMQRYAAERDKYLRRAINSYTVLCAIRAKYGRLPDGLRPTVELFQLQSEQLLKHIDMYQEKLDSLNDFKGMIDDRQNCISQLYSVSATDRCS